MTTLKLLLAFSLAAFAITGAAQLPPGRGGMAAGRGMQRGAQERPRTAEGLNPSAPTPVQLDRIEDELKLTEAQRPAWYAYADRVQKLADAMSRTRFDVRTMAVSGSATEQLDRIVADERNRVIAAEEITELGRSLYAVLTPEQKALADRRLAMPVMALLAGVAPQGADRASAPR